MQGRGLECRIVVLRSTLCAIAAILGATTWAQTTELVSVSSGGAQGNGHSSFTSISADGRYVAFESAASNLGRSDSNGWPDVFVRDRQAGTTERVSLGTGGAQGNAGSSNASISADGRWIAFRSQASTLVAGDTNVLDDVFVRDLQNGTTERVSLDSAGAQGNSGSGSPSISADGRYVAFHSAASNLVVGDTNSKSDIFVRDRQTGAIERVSLDSSGVQGNLDSFQPSISADGRYVAFYSSAVNLVAGDTNGVLDTFVRDRQAGTTEMVSVDSSGAQGNGMSYSRAISADGRYVAFWSYASNLVAGDGNASPDVFVRDRQTGTTERVSVDSGGAEGNGLSGNPSISADGRFVAFYSEATNLVAGDTNGEYDVFVRDRQAGTTERVSLDSGGAQGNSDSYVPAISADGRTVAFYSFASNLVSDVNGNIDVFARDRGAASAFAPFCFGDGSGAACPCGNSGSPGRGCENSAGTGGALLTASGVASLSVDSVQLATSGELASALSIVLQGGVAIAPGNFGDGLRCAGPTLKRLYVKSAVAGAIHAPQAGDPSISSVSAALGDPIPLGATRQYQVYYRDPSPSFCPAPSGSTFNVSGAIAVAWGS